MTACLIDQLESYILHLKATCICLLTVFIFWLDANSVTKARMRKELEEERKAAEQAMRLANQYTEEPKEVIKDSAPVLSVILYTCPDIGKAPYSLHMLITS